MLPQEEEEGEPASKSVEEEQADQDAEDETLKYHLLGPSLTKAGQDSVDQRKVRKTLFVVTRRKRWCANSRRYLRLSIMHQKDPNSSTTSRAEIKFSPRKLSKSLKRKTG